MMKFFKNMSIRSKIVVLMVMITGFIVALSTAVSVFYMVRVAKMGMVEQFSIQAKLAGEYCIAPLTFQDADGGTAILQKFESITPIVHACLYDESGKLFADFKRNDSIQGLTSLKIPESEYHFQDHFLVIQEPIMFNKKKYGKIILIITTEELTSLLRERIFYSVIIFIALILLAIFLSSYFQNIITRPVIQLAETAKRITHENDYSLRITRESEDEIGMLYEYFNQMLEKIHYYVDELEKNNRELEEFNYVASHDLREPLRTMTSYCELLEEDLKTELNPEAKQDIIFLKDAAKRMNMLIQDLLELSRTGKSNLKNEPVDLNKCMEQVVKDLQVRIDETKGKVTWDKLPVVSGDYLHLCRVLQNLVNNALKFHRTEPPRILISSYDLDAHTAKILVQDNGIGMDPQHLQQIFLPFKRLHAAGKYEGTGIGLAIVKKIVERLNGSISVESLPGQGSTFMITLKKQPI